jgi:DNA-binding NtrC family response regulator
LFIDDFYGDFEDGLKQRFGADNVYCLRYPSAREALRIIRKRDINAVLLDIQFVRDEHDVEVPPANVGYRLLQAVKKAHPDLPVFILTSHARTIDQTEYDSADGMVQKPYPESSEQAYNDFYDTLFREVSLSVRLTAVSDWDAEMGFVVGESRPMIDICRDVIRYAELWPATDFLVLGETGTGKEELARAIHRLGVRKSGPFVPVHAAALPETLLESELFGYERGAFTGANSAKSGKFEMADRGILFLDEVGEFSPVLQVKLLRFLQSRQFERLGSTRTITVDTGLIAATNRDLKADVAAGLFREDLYFRLHKAACFELPPLRNRMDIIPRLYAYFVNKVAQERGAHFDPFLRDDVKNKLLSYNYPGNIREFEQIITNAVKRARNSPLQAEDIRYHHESSGPQPATPDEQRVADAETEKLYADYNRVKEEFDGYPEFPDDYDDGRLRGRVFTVDECRFPELVTKNIFRRDPRIDGRTLAFIYGLSEGIERQRLRKYKLRLPGKRPG